MINYTFEDFEQGVEAIAKNIMAVGQPYIRIVGIARGGLFLANRLSYKLEIPMTPLCWSTRDGDERESNAWIPEDINNGDKILVVDDIIDSGKTIREIFNDWDSSVLEDLKMENISIACLFWNVDQETTPDFFHKTIERSNDDSWVNFWWEKK